VVAAPSKALIRRLGVKPKFAIADLEQVALVCLQGLEFRKMVTSPDLPQQKHRIKKEA